ncbi:MAG: hypothetical protein ACRCUS_09415, partial [Anaerovoracaceae bacterium]
DNKIKYYESVKANGDMTREISLELSISFKPSDQLRKVLKGRDFDINIAVPRTYSNTIAFLIKKGYYDPTYDNMVREKEEKNE